MGWILDNIRWIMIVSGVLTTTMVYAAIAPQAAVVSTFGETLEGPLAGILVRSWGTLVGLVGGMLIYGAFDAAVRPLVLVVAGASKAIFIGLILAQGSRYVGEAALALLVDGMAVVLFAWYLVARATVRTPATPV
jgi:hypothetical protein